MSLLGLVFAVAASSYQDKPHRRSNSLAMHGTILWPQLGSTLRALPPIGRLGALAAVTVKPECKSAKPRERHLQPKTVLPLCEVAVEWADAHADGTIRGQFGPEPEALGCVGSPLAHTFYGRLVLGGLRWAVGERIDWTGISAFGAYVTERTHT